MRPAYDAVVIGSGPNGLVAAIELATRGFSVVVLEGADTWGGGMRSAELLRPGVRHDLCATVHPLALASPALRDLPLAQHGLRWAHPEIPLAHPLGPEAVLLPQAIGEVQAFGVDAARWRRLVRPIATPGRHVVDDVLAPFGVPRDPLGTARFGLDAIGSARHLADGFSAEPARALLAGLAAHAIRPLDTPLTAGVALLLGGLAHRVGWPFVEGGSQRLADALVGVLTSLGGEIRLGEWVRDAAQLPLSRVVLADTSPQAVVSILGDRLPGRTRRALLGYRHGPGVFKLDWVLDGPVPWTDPRVGRAGTVHVGGTFAEIAAAEDDVLAGRHPDRPFVLLTQPSVTDRTRALAGEHVLWGYCHVPADSDIDMTEQVERQIERFAPGFRDRIVARHRATARDLAERNPNDVGGDIAGGVTDLRQFVFRPRVARRPWALPVPGWYLCSAAVPPGAGVHGMGGRLAARSAAHLLARGKDAPAGAAP